MEKWRRGMTAGEVFFRVGLNMSEESYARLPWRRKKSQAEAAAPVDTYASTGDVNPWIKAAAPEADNTPEADTGTPAVAPATVAAPPRPNRPDLPPWQGEQVPMRQRFWYVLLRGLVVAVLLAMVVTALRTWFFDSREQVTPPAPIPADVLYPASAASGVAIRFAHAYLSWDELDPDKRVNALRAAGWQGDEAAGWDRKGKQTTGLVTVARIAAESETRGSVTVVATVTPWKITPREGDKPASSKPGNPETIALRVPVDVSPNGALTVAAEPATVALPTGVEQDGRPLPDVDTDLSAETRSGAEAFFRAYGEETDMTAITAPGSTIVGLGGVLTFEGLSGWQVAPANGADSAQAVATVTWITKGGETQLQQTYYLTLQRTTAGSTARWQVLDIT